MNSRRMGQEQLTNETSHDASDCGRNAEQVGDGVSIKELVLGMDMKNSMDAQSRVPQTATYRDLLLGNNYGSVLPPHRDSGVPGARDGLECIF